MYVFKKTNASNLGTWWGKNQEVGNPELSVLSVGITLLSRVKISGGYDFLYQNSEFCNSQPKLENTGY